jgi:hypothetical protein
MTEPTLPREQYPALHNEALACMAELASLERGCIVSASAVFAWVATNAEALVGYAGLVWAVPVAIVAYGSLKALAIGRHISVLGAYLEELEFQTGGGDRWQKYFAKRWRTRRWASAAGWLVFVALTVAGSALGYLQFRSECPGPLVNACSQDDDGTDRGQEEQSLKLGARYGI